MMAGTFVGRNPHPTPCWRARARVGVWALLCGGGQGARIDITLRKASAGLAQQFLVELGRPGRRDADDRVVAIGRDDPRVVAEQTDWVHARLHRLDALADLVAEHRDAAVGRAEMLHA